MFRRARSPWLINTSGKLAFRTFQTIFLFSTVAVFKHDYFQDVVLVVVVIASCEIFILSVYEPRRGTAAIYFGPVNQHFRSQYGLLSTLQLIFLQIVSKLPGGCLSLGERGDWNCLISIIRLCLDNTWLCLHWAIERSAVVCIRMFGTHGP